MKYFLATLLLLPAAAAAQDDGEAGDDRRPDRAVEQGEREGPRGRRDGERPPREARPERRSNAERSNTERGDAARGPRGRRGPQDRPEADRPDARPGPPRDDRGPRGNRPGPQQMRGGGPTAAVLMRHFDRNGDGQLNTRELHSLIEVIRALHPGPGNRGGSMRLTTGPPRGFPFRAEGARRSAAEEREPSRRGPPERDADRRRGPGPNDESRFPPRGRRPQRPAFDRDAQLEPADDPVDA